MMDTCVAPIEVPNEAKLAQIISDLAEELDQQKKFTRYYKTVAEAELNTIEGLRQTVFDLRGRLASKD